MRVHFGFSFRLKNILKFLLPFAIGFLAYFGFNIMGVFAQYNPNNYNSIIFNTNDVDLDFTFNGLNKTFQEVVDELRELAISNNINFLIDIDYSSGPSGNQVRFYFNDYVYSNNTMLYDNVYLSSSIFTITNDYVRNGNTSNYFKWYSRVLTQNGNSSNNINYYNYIKNYLTNGTTTNMSTAYSLNIYQLYSVTNIDDNLIGTIHYGDRFLYDTNLNIQITNTSPQNVETRPLYVNNELIQDNVYLPSYISIIRTLNPEFNVLLDKLPVIYFEIDKNNLSNFNGQLSYVPLIDAQTYTDIVAGGNIYFYGRKNNGTYYTYDRLSCTRSASFNINDNKITHNLSNINCTNNLDNYDRIYYTETFDYLYDEENLYNHGVIGAVVSSNANHYLSKDFTGRLYTTFTNNSHWTYLFSLIPPYSTDIAYRNSDKYLLWSTLDTSHTGDFTFDKFGNVIGRDTYKYFFPNFDYYSFSSDYKTMFILYDDYITRGNDNGSTLDVILQWPEFIMISWPYEDSNNNIVYDYYNNQGTISSNSINIQYNIDSNDEGSFDLSNVFNKINSFFDSINTDMVNTHNLIQHGFNELPTELKVIIEVLFALSCIHLIYKEVKR